MVFKLPFRQLVTELTDYDSSTTSFSSVHFSCSVVSYSLRPQGLQHARLPCPSPASGAYSNSCPSRRWCHPTISSSVVPFSSCLQSFPASGSFPVSQSLHQVTKVLEFHPSPWLAMNPFLKLSRDITGAPDLWMTCTAVLGLLTSSW